MCLCNTPFRPRVLMCCTPSSTDIMVESPDEQSIVTYVAQFLEHFPELEGVSVYSYATSLFYLLWCDK